MGFRVTPDFNPSERGDFTGYPSYPPLRMPAPNAPPRGGFDMTPPPDWREGNIFPPQGGFPPQRAILGTPMSEVAAQVSPLAIKLSRMRPGFANAYSNPQFGRSPGQGFRGTPGGAMNTGMGVNGGMSPMLRPRPSVGFRDPSGLAPSGIRPQGGPRGVRSY